MGRLTFSLKMNRGIYSDFQNSAPRPDSRSRVWIFLCKM
ncbi:hypothetical protein D3OALGB2SA_4653 [Olavius algarvensis associated proteobacterium Delta 3]|nr:hypothetical protein D3OALGB2SA_4653 [Olavius algarvensis associated proteobacterium Delta 3]